EEEEGEESSKTSDETSEENGNNEEEEEEEEEELTDLETVLFYPIIYEKRIQKQYYTYKPLPTA
ncbi:MAG: hypothetical protein PHW77_06395, partial [Eubacteriales bacterium]|nr:hypothetical protein [Eubacteriales bacterium]